MKKEPWNTYEYLNKTKKDVIDRLDIAVMEEALKRGYPNNFIWVCDTLFRIFVEGHVLLNEDQMEVLMLPIKKWESTTGMVIYEMRKEMQEQVSKDRAVS